MFFHTWANIERVLLVSASMFVLIVLMLRVVGQQALAKMSGFDLVFTVTLGSVVANVAVTRTIPLLDAVVAIFAVLLLQETTRWLQARNLRVHHLVRQPPALLLWDGKLLEQKLRDSSVSADEVRAAIRSKGLSSLSEVRAVLLENNGEFSVIPKSDAPTDDSAFFGIARPGDSTNGRERLPANTPRASDQRLP
jgi:Predicted membrane protein